MLRVYARGYISLCAMLILTLSGLLEGCASGVMSPAHPYDKRGTACSETNPSLSSSEVACVVRALDQLEASCYAEADETKAKVCRDTVISITKKYIDQYWRQFVSNFYGGNAATQTVLETGIATTAAAVPIVTPKSASDILAVVAAGLTSLNTSSQKNFFGNQAVDLLLGQMEADRYMVDQQIMNGLSKSAKDYSLASAMSDLSQYALTMSVPHALQSLRQAGSKAAQVAKEKQADAIADAAAARQEALK